jgi:hypothetical protein
VGRPTGSTTRAATFGTATTHSLPRRPTLDFVLQPKLGSPITELSHGSGHVRIAVLVDAYGVAVCQTEEFGDSVRVKEIVDVHFSAHAVQITAVLGSVRGIR